MPGCGCNSELEGGLKFDGVSARYKTVLWVVIAINALMFMIESGASMLSNSMALQADALDFLGDTLTYSVTLLAIGHSLRWRARAALFKGFTLAVMGLGVLGATVYRVLILDTPNEFIMGSVAILALAANLVCALMLYKFRNGDANVRSVWLCSRNDAIGNVAVLIAAVLVYGSQSPWPDLVVAALMATLFLHSASLIFRQALAEYRSEEAVIT